MSLSNDERQLLTQFLNQLTAAPPPAKQPEADALIRDVLAKTPDAGYLLVQRTLLLEQALNAAKAQITQLESRLQADTPTGQGSFLGSNPWAVPAASAGAKVPGAGGYQLPAAPPVATPAQGAGFGGSSFLGNVATTAAGVVAGSFLFQGIEGLLGHHSSPWGGSPFGAGVPEQLSEQTTINNYYDTSPDDGQSADNYDGSFLASNDGDFGVTDDDSWV